MREQIGGERFCRISGELSGRRYAAGKVGNMGIGEWITNSIFSLLYMIPGIGPRIRKWREKRTEYEDYNGRRRRRKRFSLFDRRKGLDMKFLLILGAIIIIGLVMMFSASFPVAYFSKDSSYYFIKRQTGFAIGGLALMFLLSCVDYHTYHVFAAPMMVGAWLLMIVVWFANFGSDEPKRWLNIGPISIQVSEICKFALILFLAHWGSVYYDKMTTFKYGVAPGIVLLLITSFLLYIEPHYSGIVICGLIIAIMMALSGVKVRYFVAAAGIGGLGVFVMAITGKLTYAMSRLEGWGQALEYTTADMWNTTWQTRNSLYAIGSGGLWGLGLGQSRQKYMYLPEPQNDFVFAIVCEELGFFGALLVLILFGMLVYRGFKICMKAPDKFGMLLGVGLMAQIGLQVVLNILVITDWLPNTGISLPFFSYGGSSLIMLLAQMGIVLNISRSAAIDKT